MSIRSIGTFTAGALLASLLTFTGMQSWQADAAPGDDDTTFVPVAPCRLLNTRAGADNVGIRVAPLGPRETFPTQVTGSNGDCIGIPNDATAVAFNVTIADPTARSFLTLFPADLATRPDASNLNWLAGQSPTPNKVDVKLSPDGKVKIYNHNGTVNLIIDVVGYYTPSSLTDLQAQLTDLSTQVNDLSATVATVPSAIRDAQPVSLRYEGGDQAITSEWTSVLSTQSISLTRSGTVLAFASGTAVEFEAGADVQCVITDALTGFPINNNMRWEAAGGGGSVEGDASNLAGMESFNVDGGTTGRYHLMCRVLADTDGALMWNPQITLLFIRDR